FISRHRLLILTGFLMVAGFFFFTPGHASAANRYWVGGGSSTNWNATGNTNWGTASNTRDNASVPGSGDDVFFDGSAFGNTASTLSADITIKSLDMTGHTAGVFTQNASTTLH